MAYLAGAYPSAQAVACPADHVMVAFFHRLDQVGNIPVRRESHERHYGCTQRDARVVL